MAFLTTPNSAKNVQSKTNGVESPIPGAISMRHVSWPMMELVKLYKRLFELYVADTFTRRTKTGRCGDGTCQR